jgi:hypothetical protein
MQLVFNEKTQKRKNEWNKNFKSKIKLTVHHKLEQNNNPESITTSNGDERC